MDREKKQREEIEKTLNNNQNRYVDLKGTKGFKAT